MKTIFILLLGFGGAYPMSCSKKQPKQKQESYQQLQNLKPTEINTNSCPKHITLSSNKITIEVNS